MRERGVYVCDLGRGRPKVGYFPLAPLPPSPPSARSVCVYILSSVASSYSSSSSLSPYTRLLALTRSPYFSFFVYFFFSLSLSILQTLHYIHTHTHGSMPGSMSRLAKFRSLGCRHYFRRGQYIAVRKTPTTHPSDRKRRALA